MKKPHVVQENPASTEPGREIAIRRAAQYAPSAPQRVWTIKLTTYAVSVFSHRYKMTCTG